MRSFIISILLTLFPAIAFAAPVVELGNDYPLSNQTNITQPITTSAATITFTKPARNIIISTDSAAGDTFVVLGPGTATATNFKIPANRALVVDNFMTCTSVSILGAAATGNVSVLAW